MKQFFTPNEFHGASDSENIQAAIAASAAAGYGKILIPRLNERTGEAIWRVEQAILLPSHMTVVLDECHLRMADGVICRMFQNENADTALGCTQAGEQRDIRILGLGGATLDGGLPNGLDEFTSLKDGRPHITQNVTIYMQNVRDFSVQGVRILNQRWWGMEFLYARAGEIRDIVFELTRHAEDTWTRWRNQDGIDLRIGCSDILIDNIRGETGDDTIALTALTGPNSHESKRLIPGRDTDIHDVVIQNVRAVTSFCAIIRLLNQYGHKIYNISMREIRDVSRPGLEAWPQMALRLGENGYCPDPAKRVRHGEMYNISVDGLYTRAMTAILTAATIKNFHARNIHVDRDGGCVWACGGFGARGENVIISMYHPSREADFRRMRLCELGAENGVTAENACVEDVYYTAAGDTEALFRFNDATLRNVTVRNVCADAPLPLAKFHHPQAGSVARFERVRIAGEYVEETRMEE